jgi:hypothetical protein
MAVVFTDIILLASGADPKILARCTFKSDTKTYQVDTLLLGEGLLTTTIKLHGLPVSIS